MNDTDADKTFTEDDQGNWLEVRPVRMHPAVKASRGKDAVIAGLMKELAELRDMSDYVALFDPVAGHSVLIGVFDSDELAREACQEDWVERTGYTGELPWRDDSAIAVDGTYWSRLVERNERTSA